MDWAVINRGGFGWGKESGDVGSAEGREERFLKAVSQNDGISGLMSSARAVV